MVRRHDMGMTPYEGMIESGPLVGARRTILEMLYLSPNPLWLSRQIDAESDKLLGLAWPRCQPLSWNIPGSRNSEVNSLARSPLVSEVARRPAIPGPGHRGVELLLPFLRLFLGLFDSVSEDSLGHVDRPTCVGTVVAQSAGREPPPTMLLIATKRPFAGGAARSPRLPARKGPPACDSTVPPQTADVECTLADGYNGLAARWFLELIAVSTPEHPTHRWSIVSESHTRPTRHR